MARATRISRREIQALAGRRRAGGVDVAGLRAALEQAVAGDVRFDAGYRAVYSTDSSNYRRAPIGVVCPRDAADVAATLAACRRFGAPVTARGAGTSLAGQATNTAVVVDTSRHMRTILEVDPSARRARVEPGVIRDQLTGPLEREHGLTFPPDTSTHAYATFGGMIANNSCGAHSVMTGRTSDNLEALDVVLYDGTRLQVGATEEAELDRIIARGGRRGDLYRGMRDLRDAYAALIRERYPAIPRRVSGYNLDELLPENGFHVARALAGTEGTCALTLAATVRLTPWPRERALAVLAYETIFDAADDVPDVMAHGPMACEAFDRTMLDDMREHDLYQAEAKLLPDGGGFLLVEFGAQTREEASERARRLTGEREDARTARRTAVFDDPRDQRRIWAVRESALGSTAYVQSSDHYPGWEDAAVAPERFGEYLRVFRSLLDDYGYDTAMYGHFGQGLVHARMNFGFQTVDGAERFRAFLDDAADLVVGHGGSLSGEHGDGQARAALLPRMFGPELVRAFGEFKALWDPDGRLNPGRVTDPDPPAADLRLGPDHHPATPPVHFAYRRDGGSFAHATARCVGAGKCRDTSEGTMCPSYMVTLDEEHSTRGRARALFEMLRGDIVGDGFRSEAVLDALDLCLSCKGCKSDCPVGVDMATYKAEFLSKHYKGRLRPRPAYALGLVMLHARLAALAPTAVNRLTHAPGLGALLKRAGGLTTERPLPPFAPETFRAWFARRPPAAVDRPAVVLFADTFNNHLHPEVAKAAVTVLEAAGRRVIVPSQPLCCGRPLYDYGMLPTARRFLDGLVAGLRPHIRAGTPIVGLEPSCVAVFRDELPDMLPHDADAERLSRQTFTLAEYLAREAPEWEPPRLERRAILHGHCHHKAVMGMEAERALLDRMGLDLDELDAGCCGLAGSFGFEADHYDVSMAVGERRLLPAVREAERQTLVINDGFSCKTQIAHATPRRALHVAQVLQMALEHGAAGVRGDEPERAYPDVRS